MPAHTADTVSQYRNYAPADLNPQKDLPKGFFDFLLPLHQQFTPRQQKLVAKRAEVLQRSHAGQPPNYLAGSEATTSEWRIEVPDWCADQRNQMTGPADDAELTVKLLNSGSPAVMLDLEDSTANIWEHILLAVKNTIAAYKLTFGLLLGFAAQQTGKRPSELDIADLDAPLIAHGRPTLPSRHTPNAAASPASNPLSLQKNLVLMYALTLFELFKPAGNNLHI